MLRRVVAAVGPSSVEKRQTGQEEGGEVVGPLSVRDGGQRVPGLHAERP